MGREPKGKQKTNSRWSSKPEMEVDRISSFIGKKRGVPDSEAWSSVVTNIRILDYKYSNIYRVYSNNPDTVWPNNSGGER